MIGARVQEAPVRVRVRLSGELARAAGAPRAEVEVPEGATVAELLARLAEARPALAPALRRALPMVGGGHADPARALAPGEEVALLLPAAGGGGGGRAPAPGRRARARPAGR